MKKRKKKKEKERKRGRREKVHFLGIFVTFREPRKRSEKEGDEEGVKNLYLLQKSYFYGFEKNSKKFLTKCPVSTLKAPSEPRKRWGKGRVERVVLRVLMYNFKAPVLMKNRKKGRTFLRVCVRGGLKEAEAALKILSGNEVAQRKKRLVCLRL